MVPHNQVLVSLIKTSFVQLGLLLAYSSPQPGFGLAYENQFFTTRFCSNLWESVPYNQVLFWYMGNQFSTTKFCPELWFSTTKFTFSLWELVHHNQVLFWLMEISSLQPGFVLVYGNQFTTTRFCPELWFLTTKFTPSLWGLVPHNQVYSWLIGLVSYNQVSSWLMGTSSPQPSFTLA